MATITSVTTTGQPGDPATIAGTGFGATQGTTVLLFYSSAGVSKVLTPVSWSATSILTAIPSDADITVPCFFEVLLSTSDITVKSPIVNTVAVTVKQSQSTLKVGDIGVADPEYAQATPNFQQFIDKGTYKTGLGIIESVDPGTYTVQFVQDKPAPQTVPVGGVAQQGPMITKFYGAFGLTPVPDSALVGLLLTDDDDTLSTDDDDSLTLDS